MTDLLQCLSGIGSANRQWGWKSRKSGTFEQLGPDHLDRHCVSVQHGIMKRLLGHPPRADGFFLKVYSCRPPIM